MQRIVVSLAFAFASFAVIPPVLAQAPQAQPLQIFPPALPTPQKGEARITVNYNSSEKLPPDVDAGTLLVTQAKAHRAIYDIAGQECKVLLDTIASECRIETVNITASTQQRPVPNASGGITESWLSTNGTSTFHIKTKE
jgi:hypothetical protein